MCGGVEYVLEAKKRKTFFPMPHAQLPILMRSGNLKLFEWGRREKEEGHLPATGWARMDSIQDGKWKRYHPRPVRIIVDRYMEKDNNRESHWFKLEPGYYIEGLLLPKLAMNAAYTSSQSRHQPTLPRIKFDPVLKNEIIERRGNHHHKLIGWNGTNRYPMMGGKIPS